MTSRSNLINIKRASPLAIIVVLILLVYSSLINVFFQQDEWHSFGHIISKGLGGYLTSDYASPLFVITARPIAKIFTALCFRLFGLNYFYYGLVSILFHILNSVLVYFLASKLSKNRVFPLLASLFFALNSVAAQGIIWFSALNSAAISFTFLLLALISFSYFFERGQKRYFYFSLLAFVLSVLAKESSLFLIVLLPLFSLIFKAKKKILTAENLSFLGVGIVYSALRFLQSITPLQLEGVTVTSQESDILRPLLNLISYPLEGLSQIFVPAPLIYFLAERTISLFCPWLWQSSSVAVARETIFSEFVSLVVSLFLLIFILLLGWHLRKKKKMEEKTLWFSLAFLLTSFLPYIFLKKSTAFLESRHYYPGILGGALLFGLLLSEGWAVFFPKKNRRYWMALFVCAILFLFGHLKEVQREIKVQSEMGAVRRMILEKIREKKPKLGQKTIFYIDGNVPYVRPEVKIPFQQGFGWTLLVWYYETGTVEPQFFTDESLWGILNQGYKEYGGKGFGYFWDDEELVKAVREDQLELENIYAFFYDAHQGDLLDITFKVRQKLKGEL